MRTIGVVTAARSDYGILRPVLRRIDDDPELELRLVVCGAHLSAEHGLTIEEIEQDGFPIAERVDLLAASDEPAAVAVAIGAGVAGLAAAFERTRPEIVLLLGDRFEMLAAAAAALPLRLPLAHVHGGESSEGSFDELIRHALTKLSHLHFASAEAHARRIVQMGEEPWRVIVSGAPALDGMREAASLDDEELERRVGMPVDGRTLLVTYHPATLDPGDVGGRVRELLAAVERSDLRALFTYPNADPGGAAVRRELDAYVRSHGDACAVPSLGSSAYYAVLRRVAAMVGNSSSGLIEAPSFGLPVVNVGVRQEGRLRAANVIDVSDDADAILEGIRRAVSPGFRESLAGLVSPYGDGHAAERIVETLKRVEPGPLLLIKRFQDLDA